MRLNLAPIGQEAGFARGASHDQRSGPDRREWWVMVQRASELDPHPLQPLAGAYGARFAGIYLSSSSVVGYRYTPPRTHPSPIPVPSTRPYRTPCTACSSVLLVPGTCTYDRFWDVLGEPRGLEHTAVSGSRTGLLRFIDFARPYDWIIDCFMTVLLSYGPRLLSYGPRLLSYGPRIDLELT